MKINLKVIGFCAFLISFLLSCEKDLYENIVDSAHNEPQFHRVNISELSNDSEFVKVYSRVGKLKVRNKGNILSKSILENQYGFTIIDSVVNLVEYSDKKSFSFLIKKDSLAHNKFQNLLVEIESPTSSKFTIIDYEKGVLTDGSNKVAYDILNMNYIAFEPWPAISSQQRLHCVSTMVAVCSSAGTPWDCGGNDNNSTCYRYKLNECTDDGSGGGASEGASGSSGGPTIAAPNPGPQGGGGSSSGATKPPCKQLQDALNKQVVNRTVPTIVKDVMNDLINQMPTNPRERFYEMNPTVANESSFGATLTEGEINGDGIENYNPGTNVVSIMLHCHYKLSQYSVFSLADLQNIFALIAADNIASPETFTSILVTIHGSRYALKIKPQQDNLNNAAQNFFTGWDFDNIRELREKSYDKSVKSTFTKEKQEIGLLQFLKEQNLGLELYKADNNFNWSKLTLSTTGQDVKITPCP